MAKGSEGNARGGGDGAPLEAVDRAARVLFALAAQPVPSTLAEVAQRADLTKPTAFRILATLIAEGHAAQNPETGAYRLGGEPLRIGARVLGRVAVREPALAAMRVLRDAINETIVLSIRDGDHRYNIDSVEAENAIAQAQQIGVAIPLYTGAASRVLLAGLDDDELAAYLERTPLRPFSNATIVDALVLREDIARTRQRGYAVSNGEFASSGNAVAMAIRGADGRPVAAIHVSAPSSRFSPRVEDICVAALRRAIDGIEAVSAPAPRPLR
jgi:DNA-binding IclR family transcriptional regulator